MNTLIKKLLWIVLFALLLVLGVVFLAFTSVGNTLVKPYVKEKLEEKIGKPIEVDTFSVGLNHALVNFTIDQEAKVHLVTEHNLLQRTSTYSLSVNDINTLLPQKRSQPIPIAIDGVFNFGDEVTLSAEAKGFGDALTFFYSPQGIQINASKVDIERLLALAGVPVYVKGKVDTQVVLTHTDALKGNFTAKGDHLVTEPSVMQKQIEEPLAMNIAFDASGILNQGKGEAKVSLRSPLADVTLAPFTVDIDHKTFQGEYLVAIPHLEKLQKIIKQKLYGPLVLKGTIEQKEKVFNATAKTTTLGGAIVALLSGEDAHATLTKVPVENIMGLLGQKPLFLGEASGETQYNLKQKSGTADLTIDGFQVKSTQWTQLVTAAIGKDPSRVIFSSTTLHAQMKNNVTTYELHAKGTRSSIDITEGKLDKVNQTNNAQFKFVYEKYTVNGKITGSPNDPQVTLDTSALLKDKLDEKLQQKLDKALGGQVGSLLKGLKF
jgi:hypothetical protein